MVIGVRLGEESEMMWTRRIGSGSQSARRLFFFFLKSPEFGQKNPLIFGEDLYYFFVGDHLILTE